MALLVSDCPRCGAARMTLDVQAAVHRYEEYGWKHRYELFGVCRSCSKPTIFLVAAKSYEAGTAFHRAELVLRLNDALTPYFEVERVVTLRDNAEERPPDQLPRDIRDAFTEGATCLAIGCNNAAAAMFRLCVDLVTRPLLPNRNDTSRPQPNEKTRRDLGLRLRWMFYNKILPESLREVAACIREDANDGAHVGNLTKEDAADLVDFTRLLLERLITEPARLKLAEERRKARRAPAQGV